MQEQQLYVAITLDDEQRWKQDRLRKRHALAYTGELFELLIDQAEEPFHLKKPLEQSLFYHQFSAESFPIAISIKHYEKLKRLLGEIQTLHGKRELYEGDVLRVLLNEAEDLE